MLERGIVDHAFPTLARLKLGSLINLDIGEGFFGEFARLSDALRGKGVKLTILRLRGGKALLYVYWPDELDRLSGNLKSAKLSIKDGLLRAVR